MPKTEPETEELINRLDEIGEQISIETENEFNNKKKLENLTERLERNAKEIENHMENNEAITHDRKVEEMLNDLRGDIKSVENRLEEVDNTRQTIKSTQSQIENIRDALASVVEEGLDTKIVKEFQKRREELDRSLLWWKAWSILSIFLLFLSTAYVYSDIDQADTVSNITISKVLLIFPVLVAVWFSFHQYNKHKMLIEQYEFKTSMADSLMGFREILRQDFPDDKQERVGEFVIDSVNKIYMNPENSMGGSNSSNDGEEVPKSNTDILRIIRNLNK